MAYTFLKPKTTNISKETWNIVKTKPWFWLPMPFVLIFGLPVLILPVLIFVLVLNKTAVSFWKGFADVNGWKYKDETQSELFFLNSYGTPNEKGIMFKEGHSRVISHEINGVIQGRTFRIFSYRFSIGHGKSQSTYYYTVFGFKFNGSFPHIYLNNKHNTWDLDKGEKIPLPAEFEKEFSLFAPKKYEIEALEIFTPDILDSLLTKEFPYDVEFINQEVLIFAEGKIKKIEQLESDFSKSLELEELMSKKLDNFKFEQIGDLSPVLK